MTGYRNIALEGVLASTDNGLYEIAEANLGPAAVELVKFCDRESLAMQSLIATRDAHCDPTAPGWTLEEKIEVARAMDASGAKFVFQPFYNFFAYQAAAAVLDMAGGSDLAIAPPHPAPAQFAGMQEWGAFLRDAGQSWSTDGDGRPLPQNVEGELFPAARQEVAVFIIKDSLARLPAADRPVAGSKAFEDALAPVRAQGAERADAVIDNLPDFFQMHDAGCNNLMTEALARDSQLTADIMTVTTGLTGARTLMEKMRLKPPLTPHVLNLGDLPADQGEQQLKLSAAVNALNREVLYDHLQLHEVNTFWLIGREKTLQLTLDLSPAAARHLATMRPDWQLFNEAGRRVIPVPLIPTNQRLLGPGPA